MRIALVAMSGVRACDTELMELGLNLPGFVERSKVIASLPSLGLLTLAAMTPGEHEVEYIEMPDLTHADQIPGNFDLAAISSYTMQIEEAYELARRCRDAGTSVVMGGPHATACPDEALESCDAVVAGEGEAVWAEVLADCADSCMEGIYDARTRKFRIADSPIPAFELLDLSNYNRLTVQTSRGCPHHCEFCASSVLLTDGYKQKPVDHVVAEIERIYKLWDHPFIEFADDNAFVHHRYWKELLRALPDRRMRWFAETDLSVARDEELLDLMHASGCAQVLIGFESPSRTDLDGVELTRNWKHANFSEYRDAISTVQSHGITVNGCFVLGLDGQSPGVFDEVFEFVKETDLYEVQITVMTPFPGTPLYDRLAREDRLLEPTRWEKCSLFDVNFRPSDMTVSELESGLRSLGTRLYSEEFTAHRRNAFKNYLRTAAKHTPA